MTDEIEINGVVYIPKPPPEPKWECDVIHDDFLTDVLPTLKKSPDQWTSGTLDVIYRQIAYEKAAMLLVWYRDKVAELKHLQERVAKSEYD